MADAAEFTRERLFTMMAGYKSTAVLRATVALGLCDALAQQPVPARTVAEALGVDETALAALLQAGAGLGLFTVDGDRYGLAPGVADLLVRTAPGYCGGITSVAASDMEWDALGRLADTVRGGGPVPGVNSLVPDFPYWVDFAQHTTFVTTALAGVVADALADWVSTKDTLAVLDAGCGHGLIGFELAARHPGARVYAQDWPAVLAQTRTHAQRRGVLERTEFLPGDVFTRDLGGPYDVVVAGNLLFHFGPSQVAALLDRLVGVLAPDGRLVVAGFTTGDQDPAIEAHAALLGLLMVSSTPAGRMYSSRDYEKLLADAGLPQVRVHTRPKLLPRVLVAQRLPG